MKKTLICIGCPRGCHLTAEKCAGQPSWSISGNGCPRGEAFAVGELTDPRRVVTAVVRTENGSLPCLPVRTDAAFPKNLIAKLLNRLYSMRIPLPVKRGTVIMENVENTGINVIAGEDAQ